jgi:histidine ammonia-lyase
MEQITLTGDDLTLEQVHRVANAPATEVEVTLAPEAGVKIRRAQGAIQKFVESGEIIYGVTTGFGAFKDRLISAEDVKQLQRNIIMSHAVGVGPPLDAATTRAMMLIRINTLAKGHSGIREETLQLLIAMLNDGMHPIIPSQGSLGASGDLAPLAHMSLPLIGLGEVIYQGERMTTSDAFAKAGFSVIELEAKEGLALTNGTAMMAAIGVLITIQAENLLCVADIAGCLSLEALHGTAAAFDERIHAVRPHPRQIECAAYLRKLLEESTFTRSGDTLDVQDAYTLRCIPQVHGAIRDAVLYSRWVLNIELNAATDNPLLFFDESSGEASVLSGGNFHGEPVAIAMDYLALALTELGNISERRLTRLTDESSNQEALPAFLTEHGGLNSGFMLTQYTAAALASENKVLAHPASSDTIPTSANMEDHVSMGATAARQAAQIADNVERILSLELLAAAQGIDFRRKVLGPGAKMGKGTQVAYDNIRRHVDFLERDATMQPLIEAVWRVVSSGELVDTVHEVVPENVGK